MMWEKPILIILHIIVIPPGTMFVKFTPATFQTP